MSDDNLAARLDLAAEIGWRDASERTAAHCVRQAKALILEGRPELAIRYLHQADAELERAQGYPSIRAAQTAVAAQAGRAA